MSLQLIPPDINLDFVGKRKFFVALSTVINLAAIVLLIFVGLNYGVDFAGGSLVQLKFDRPTSADQIRKALGSLDLGEITVQDFGGSSSNQYLVRFAMVKNIGSLGKRLEGALNESYGSSNKTLSRTILTSGTALTVLASLLVLGGPILRPAAFTLFIGIITGTYSSIYIAGPVVLFWERGHRARGAVSRAA